MTCWRQELGKRGETIAAQWLVERGWRVVQRRFRAGHRDIDLVVERAGIDGRLIAFVEVKTRAAAGYGGAISAVGWRKQAEMTKAARVWVARNRKGGDLYRFDVVAILCNGETVDVVHVEDAFRVR